MKILKIGDKYMLPSQLPLAKAESFQNLEVR